MLKSYIKYPLLLDRAKKVQNTSNYTGVEKKYGRTKVETMINSLNKFNELYEAVCNGMILFLESNQIVDGKLLHQKAVNIASSIGFESFVGSFAGIWDCLTKRKVKLKRKSGSLSEVSFEPKDLIQILDGSEAVIELSPSQVEYVVLDDCNRSRGEKRRSENQSSCVKKRKDTC